MAKVRWVYYCVNIHPLLDEYLFLFKEWKQAPRMH